MEEKKFKEIEAKLNKLLSQANQSEHQRETASTPPKINSGGVIRRRKGQKDLLIK